MQRKVESFPWSAEDDEVLREAVSIHGAKAWSAIACGLPRRSSKECRARWLVLERLDATQPEYKRVSAPAAMTAHLHSTTVPASKVKPAPPISARSRTKSTRSAGGAARPTSPQPLISRLPIPPYKKSSRQGTHGSRTLIDAYLSPSSGNGAKDTNRDEQSEKLPASVSNLTQQQNDVARKRARLSPQAFLEEALSPHHMSISSVCSPSVEICDAMTLTGSEQLADDIAGSDMDSVTMDTDEPVVEHHNCDTTIPELEIGHSSSSPADPAAFSLGLVVPTAGGVRPVPLQCVADEYCAEDEAFLHPRTPIVLREVDADEISADPVRAFCHR